MRNNRSKRAFQKRKQNAILADVIKDLAVYGRVVNMIAIKKELKSGKLKLKDLVRELLNLKESLTPELSINNEVTGLADDVAVFISKAEKECGGDGEPCSKLDSIRDGAARLKTVPQLPVDFRALFQEGGLLQNLGKMKKFHDDVASIKKNVEILGKQIETFSNATDDMSKVAAASQATAPLKDIKSSIESLSAKLTNEQLEAFTKENLEAAFDKVLALENISLHLNGQTVTLDLLEKRLFILTNLLLSVNPLFSDGNLENVENKGQFLVECIGDKKLLMNEKTATHGFHNGADDLGTLPSDLKTSFVTSTLANGKGLEFIQPLVPFFSDLYKKIKSILKTKNSVKSQELNRHVKQLNNVLKSAKTEIDTFNVIPKLYEHVKKLNEFVKNFDADDWRDEKRKVGSLMNGGKTFIDQLDGISFQFDALSGLLAANIKGTSDTLLVWGNQKEFDSAKSEWTALNKTMTTLDESLIAEWVGKTTVDGLINNKAWLKNNDIDSVLEFLRDQTVITSVIDVIGDRSSLTALIKLQSDEGFVVEINKAVGALKQFIDGWSTLEKGLSSRSVEPLDQDIDKIDLQVNKQLNSALKIFIDLANAFFSMADIEEFNSKQKGIEDHISKLSSEQKKEADLLWGPEQKKTFNKLPILASQMTSSMKFMPKQLLGYQKVFQLKIDFGGTVDLNIRDFMEFLEANNAPYPTRPVAERLGALELNFSNGSSLIRDGLQAFLITVPFFTGLMPNSNSRLTPVPLNSTSSDSNTSSGGMSDLAIGLIAGGVVVGGVALGLGTTYIVIRNKKGDYIEIIDYSRVEIVTLKDGDEFIRIKPEKGTEKNKSRGKYLLIRFKIMKDRPEKELEDDVVKIRDYEPMEMTKQENAHCRDVIEMGLSQEKINESLNKLASVIVNTKICYFSKEFVKHLSQVRFNNTMRRSNNAIKVFASRKDYYVGRGYVTFETPNMTETVVPVPVVEEPLPVPVDLDSSAKYTKHLTKMAQKVEQTSNKKIVFRQRWMGGADALIDDEDVLRYNKSGSETKRRRKLRQRMMGGVDALNDAEVLFYNMSGLTAFNLYLNSNEGKRKPLDFSLEDPTVEVDHSERFFTDNIVGDDGKINYGHIISGMFLEKMVSIKKWPHTSKKTNITTRFPFPLHIALQIMKDAGEIWDKEDPVIYINREQTKVFGDIHGRYADLINQLNLGIKNDDASFLCLGDLVDRGPRGIDVVLLMCILKVVNRDKIFLLRGNHEFPYTNQSYGFLYECLRVFGPRGGRQFYLAANEMFIKLPRIAVVNSVTYCAHGGISKEMAAGWEAFAGKIKKVPTTKEEVDILLNIEWSDPVDYFMLDLKKQGKYFKSSKRGLDGVQNYTILGLTYYMNKSGMKFVVRAHEIVPYGFKAFAGTLAATIYGSTNNKENNWACQVTIYADNTVHMERFINKGDKKEEEEVEEEDEPTLRLPF